MKPAKFAEQNKTLQKPSTMTDKECTPLPIFTDGKQCISLWAGNLRERIKFLFTGKIWFSSLSGKTQPPVWLKMDYPFSKKDRK